MLRRQAHLLDFKAISYLQKQIANDCAIEFFHLFLIVHSFAICLNVFVIMLLNIQWYKEYDMTEIIKFIPNMNPDNLTEEHNFFIRESKYLPVSVPTPCPIQPIHRHPFYEFIFVTKGEGTMMIDFKENAMQKGALYLLSPSQIHLPLVTGEFHCYLLRFDLSVFAEKAFFENLSIFHFDSILVEEPSYTILETLLKTLHEEFYTDKKLRQYTLTNLLKLLLINVQRLLPDIVNAPVETSHFSKLNQLMEKNHYKITNPSEYAHKLNIPIKVLNAVVKEYTGLTCGDYIRSKTIIEIKRLLSYTNMNASEICVQLGFVDTAYFSRFFKRETGLSPLGYRKSTL